MNLFFPVIELVDRYAIAKLKFDKTQKNQAELNFYVGQLKHYDLSRVAESIDKLYSIHANIWALESELMSGTEQNLDLEEIGRRAIAIRDFNNRRIAYKNSVASILGHVVKEIKQDHLADGTVDYK
jgi:hypothetical protein